MARPGLLKTFHVRDPDIDRLQSNLRDAVDTLTSDDDVFRSPAFYMVKTGPIPPGRSVVVFTGPSGQSLTLPLASSQGQNVSAQIVIANTSANAVTILSSGKDTVNGGTSVSLAAGSVATFVSDGVSGTSG